MFPPKTLKYKFAFIALMMPLFAVSVSSNPANAAAFTIPKANDLISQASQDQSALVHKTGFRAIVKSRVHTTFSRHKFQKRHFQQRRFSKNCSYRYYTKWRYLYCGSDKSHKHRHYR